MTSITRAVAIAVALVLTVSSGLAQGTGEPRVPYSTFFGGGSYDLVNALAVAPDGTMIVVNGSEVSWLSADGSRVLSHITVLGASPTSVALAPDGSIFIAGSASSGILRTVRPIQAQPLSTQPGFVAQINASLTQVLFCSYLSGSSSTGISDTYVNGIAVDAEGHVLVVGSTQADNDDWPLANATQSTYGGGYTDGFLTVIDTDAASLVFSTYFGGADIEELTSVDVDSDTGAIYVAGSSEPEDPSVARGDCVGYLTLVAQYIKGSAPNEMELRAIREGCAKGRYKKPIVKITRLMLQIPVKTKVVVADSEESADDDLTGEKLGGVDVRLWTYDEDLNQERTRLVGGAGDEYPVALAADDHGIVYLLGESSGDGLPLLAPIQPGYGGDDDAFVMALDVTSLQPALSSYLGGSGYEDARAIAVDKNGDVYLGGSTNSPDFPTTANALRRTLSGPTDGWITKLRSVGDLVPDFALALDPRTLTVTKGESGSFDVTISRSGGFEGRVTVLAPDTKAIKVKLKPAQSPTTGDSVTITFKVKRKAPAGTYDLTFTGRDEDGRERTATLALTIS